MNKNYLKSIVLSTLAMAALSSCVDKDEWSTPPMACNNKFDAANSTLADVKAMAPATGYKLIESDVIFDGYVVSSDENGNFYKTISFQDKPENPTAGLQIEVDRASNYADLPVGAHIRINAKGLRVGTDRGVVKLGSVDPTYAIGRIPGALFSRYISGVCNGSGMEIAKIAPVQLPSLKAAQDAKYINMLVTVPNVQFSSSELGKTYVDFVGGAGADTDRKIEDATGGNSILRSSGFFSGGATTLPTGKGDLTFVVSRYNASWQMLIRSLADVNFTSNRIDKFYTEDFSGTPLTDRWTTVSVIGAQTWSIAQFGNPKPSAMMSGNSGGTNYANEDWLVSKPIDLAGYTSPSLTFETDARYAGNALEVYVTDNFTGTPSTTTWTKLNPALDTDLNAFAGFVSSGVLDLKAFEGKKISVAFKYTSTTTSATSWEVDNVAISGTKK